MRQQHDHDRSTSAFTLIEVLLVVVILSLVAAIAIPMFGSVGINRLSAASRMVIADVEFARTRSLGSAADRCLIEFDIQENDYMLVLESDPSTPITNPVTGDPYRRQFGKGLAAGMEGVILDSVSLGGDNRLMFKSDGSLDQSTDAYITISGGSTSLTVVVDANLGRATADP